MAESSVDIGCAVRGLLACRYFCALGSSDGGIVGDGCICCLSQEEMSSVYFRSVSCDSRCTTDVLYFRTCSSQSLGTVCCRLARLLVECSREVPLAFLLLAPLRKGAWPAVVLSIALLTGGVVWLLDSTFTDANFLNTLRQKQAFESGDYEKVVEIARSQEQPPTRLQVMLTREALWQSGRAGDMMFACPDGDAPCASPRPFQYLRLLCGRLLYYYEGKVNYAYRWCMEDMVEYGLRPDYLKYMLKCAVINGEAKLAEKYASALRHTLWYSHIADQYSGLIGNPSKVAADKEMRRILPLMRYGDVLDGDGGMIEVYLLNSYAYSSGGSREIVERALMNSLIMKNLDGFWPRFMSLLEGWKGHVPIHCQEAALMVAQLKGGVDVSVLPIDDTVRQRFERLVELSAQNGDQASNAYMLRPEFGDTYWYYYFFVEGLKTN